MTPLRIDEIQALLPQGDELRALLERLVAFSRPDPERRWTASGELGTAGDRLADPERVRSEVAALAERTRAHLEALYGAVLDALAALERGHPEAAAGAFLRAAALEEEEGRPERAEGWAWAAARVAGELKDRRMAARALRIAGRAARARGRLLEAERAYEEAWSTARLAGAGDEAVVAGTGRGNVAIDRGRWIEAGRWYGEALDLIGLEGPPQRERWQLHQNLSIVARHLGRLEEATRWLDRAEAEASALDDAGAEVEVGNSRGRVALAAGDPLEAERLLRRALSAAAPGRPRAVVLVNLAEALLAQGHVLDAAEAAREAEREALTRGVVPLIPEVYRLLGRIAAARGHEEAFVFLERALEWAEREGAPPYEVGRTQEAYAEIEVARGDGEAARARLRRAAELYAGGGNDADRERVLRTLAEQDGTGDGGTNPEEESA